MFYTYIEKVKQFSPILILIIIFSFCNPSIIGHMYKTFNSQDYYLNNVSMKNSDNFNSIIKLIDQNKSITYIEEGRYLNTYFSDSYINKMWLPIHPASLFQPLSNERINLYIKRWINRNDPYEGWLIFQKESHWNKRIVTAIENSLKNYKTIKIINHKNLKAILLRKNVS